MRKTDYVLLAILFVYLGMANAYGQKLDSIFNASGSFSLDSMGSGYLYATFPSSSFTFGSYTIQFNPDYKLFNYNERFVIQDMMQFEMNVPYGYYGKWARYIKAKYKKTDKDAFINVVHKDGTDTDYTLEQFRQYLWPHP